jgi:hypothetical protein
MIVRRCKNAFSVLIEKFLYLAGLFFNRIFKLNQIIMLKKVYLVSIIALILSSCGNAGRKDISSNTEGSPEAVKIEFASLISDPSSYIGKNISVEGKVVHVCTHSGKKLFITGENPDVRLYVQAGEEMPKFPMELLGSEIVVEGTLTQIPATGMTGEGGMNSGEDMKECEGMNAGEGMAKAAGTDTCETEKALASQPVLSDLMMVYNKHTLVK